MHFLTASLSEASILSPTVQLDFTWTLEMSDWQNDWFGSPSGSLRNSLTTMCTSSELFHREIFGNEKLINDKLGIQKNVIIL